MVLKEGYGSLTRLEWNPRNPGFTNYVPKQTSFHPAPRFLPDTSQEIFSTQQDSKFLRPPKNISQEGRPPPGGLVFSKEIEEVLAEHSEETRLENQDAGMQVKRASAGSRRRRPRAGGRGIGSFQGKRWLVGAKVGPKHQCESVQDLKLEGKPDPEFTPGIQGMGRDSADPEHSAPG